MKNYEFRSVTSNSKLTLGLSAICLILGTFCILPYGDFRDLEAMTLLWRGIVIMGLGFALSWRLTTLNKGWFWGVTLVTRLLLLPMYPSSDIWRYLWEGYLQTQGISPYDFAPIAEELMTYRTSWWELINHADVSAIYPPITQIGFRFLATLVPSVLLFKLAFVGADIIVCVLLRRQFGSLKATLYAWNPIVIYSFAGGGHYDSWLVLSLVAAWISFEGSQRQKNWSWTALLLGISIAVKWISLPVLGFLGWLSFKQKGIKHTIPILLLGILPFLLSAIPFCHGTTCPLIPTSSVFVSYGRSAELVPYLLSQVWEASRWHNWIHGIPLGIGCLLLFWRVKTLGTFCRWYFFLLLILSPIFHSWYLTWLIPFAVGIPNWGVRLGSLSVFIYFVLFYRILVEGYESWYLTDLERFWLWSPLVVGWFWQCRVKGFERFFPR